MGHTDEGKPENNLEKVLSLLGQPGRFQIIQFIVLSVQYHPLSFNDYMPIFYGLPPREVDCRQSDRQNSVNSSERLSFPNFTGLCETGNKTAGELCPAGLGYCYQGRQWSVIADMDLICAKSVLVELSATIYFLGQIVATPVFGWGADRFGRRITLLLSSAMYSGLCVGLVFSRDYMSFVLLRFCMGLATQGINSSFYVLLVEWLPAERRGSWGAIAEVQYTVGTLILALVAYLLEDWRHIQIFVAAYSSLSVLLVWFAPESLGWSWSRHRMVEIESNCTKVLRFNNLALTPEISAEIRILTMNRPESAKSNEVHSFYDCFRTPYLRQTTVLCCYIWLATYVGYLGLVYMSSEIASNIYLNLAINAFLEFVPIACAAGIATRLGNRLPLTYYFLCGGILSIVAGSIPGDSSGQLIGQNTVAFLGRMCFVGCICIIFVYTSELFPTVIRNNGFSLCSVALRVGSVIAPLLPLMSNRTSYKGSGFLLVGFIAVTASGAAILLRETKGQHLIERIEDTKHIAFSRTDKWKQQLAARLSVSSQASVKGMMRRKTSCIPEPSLHLPMQGRAPVVPVDAQDPALFANTDADVEKIA